MTKLFAILAASILVQAAPFLTSTSFAGNGPEASQTEDHLYRHCVDGSKYEHCYWVEKGDFTEPRDHRLRGWNP